MNSDVRFDESSDEQNKNTRYQDTSKQTQRENSSCDSYHIANSQKANIDERVRARIQAASEKMNQQERIALNELNQSSEIYQKKCEKNAQLLLSSESITHLDGNVVNDQSNVYESVDKLIAQSESRKVQNIRRILQVKMSCSKTSN